MEFINSACNAYCEPTPDGLLLEVTLIGFNGAAAASEGGAGKEGNRHRDVF